MKHVDDETLAMLAVTDTVADDDVAAHLAACAVCRDAVAEFQRVAAVTRSSADLELVAPPERVWDRIQAAVRAEQDADRRRGSTPPRRSRTPSPRLRTAAGRSGRPTRWRPACGPRDRGPSSPTHDRRGRRGGHRVLALLVGIGVVTGVVPGAGSGETVVATTDLSALPSWSGARGNAELERDRDGRLTLVVDVHGDGDRNGDAGGLREVWMMQTDLKGLVSVGYLDGDRGRFGCRPAWTSRVTGRRRVGGARRRQARALRRLDRPGHLHVPVGSRRDRARLLETPRGRRFCFELMIAAQGDDEWSDGDLHTLLRPSTTWAMPAATGRRSSDPVPTVPRAADASVAAAIDAVRRDHGRCGGGRPRGDRRQRHGLAASRRSGCAARPSRRACDARAAGGPGRRVCARPAAGAAPRHPVDGVLPRGRRRRPGARTSDTGGSPDVVRADLVAEQRRGASRGCPERGGPRRRGRSRPRPVRRSGTRSARALGGGGLLVTNGRRPAVVRPGDRVARVDSPRTGPRSAAGGHSPSTAHPPHDWAATGVRAGWVQPDWAAVAEEFDVVHLTVAGWFRCSGIAIAVDDTARASSRVDTGRRVPTDRRRPDVSAPTVWTRPEATALDNGRRLKSHRRCIPAAPGRFLGVVPRVLSHERVTLAPCPTPPPSSRRPPRGPRHRSARSAP